MRSLIRCAFGALAGLSVASFATPLAAQGSLSLQGFGYPGGQLSTRALSTGGALADFDAQSPLNPAALSLGQRASVYLQYDPEFRSVSTPDGQAKTTTARFPLFAVTGKFNRATFGLAFSSFLERSWVNTRADTQVLNGERIPSTLAASSKGGINDVRVAASWAFSPRFHVGLGLHAFPGENRVEIGRTFGDSSLLGAFDTVSTVTYGGSAVSVGFMALPIRHLNVAAALRIGGTMQIRAGDSTVLGEARIPKRWSGSVAYDGIPGAAFGVRYAAEKWTDMIGLGSKSLPVYDATDVSVGGEVGGPKIAGVGSAIRAGWRTRQLPFGVAQGQVKEASYTVGAGIPLAFGRTMLDLGAVHARRTAGSWAETGWILSVALSIRP
jgi:hypothetical protein